MKIDRIAEERMVEIFAPDGTDQSFHEWVRHRDIGHRLDLRDLEDPQVRGPPVKAEQWVAIRTDPNVGWVAGNGVIEHAAQSWTVDGFVADAEAADSADEHIDDHTDPMTAK